MTATVVLALVKSVVILFALLTGFAYATFFERRVVARMQSRLGPNRAGPAGLLQPLADGIKLLFKENTMPSTADRFTYFLAPALAIVVAVLTFAVIPISDPVTFHWAGQAYTTPLALADVNVALLFVMGVTSLGVYGVVLAGWSSDNKYSLLGGMRSAAQMVSYELALGASVVGVVLIAGTLSVTEIVASQETWWYAALQPLGFVVFCVAVVAETNRAPFDLPEAEQELIGGYHTEYSGFRFAMFFMAEYIHMITASALAASLFLGGYRLPCARGTVLEAFCEAPWYVDVAVFSAKVLAGLFLFVWVRATLPRLRYDRLMQLGWKVMLPLGLANAALTAAFLAWYAAR
jgi:NADH-quinone oxidoreductase subunit H